MELISFESIVRPVFINWSMKLLDVEDIDPGVKRFLMDKYPNNNGEFNFFKDFADAMKMYSCHVNCISSL